MDYRSHYPGDFDTHLDLLEESIERQKEWAGKYQHLWIGIATQFLYDEEREPLVRMRELVASGGSAEEIRAAWNKVAGRLGEYAPDLAKAMSEYLREAKDREAVQNRLNAFLANIPPGYYPPEKLLRTLERVRKTGVEGIVIFSAGGISSARLWDAVERFFSE
jgi:HEAT repeat protein